MVSSRPHIDLLGGAHIVADSGVDRLEKKTAALLAYLALEGPTGRSRVAGLLWPESKEATARNNLAQVVRRLRTNVGVALVEGDATLKLADATCDVVELLRLVQNGDFAAAIAYEGELLEGYDFDSCPELEEWLRGVRSRVRRAFTKAAESEIDRLQAAHQLDDAIAVAERLLAADPLIENSHLRVARLWLARGDAAAAMRAYDHCKKTLARELAMKPSPAMVEVHRAILAGKPQARPAASALPASVLRPKWVGRAKEWGFLERAHSARRIVMIDGEPGVGKSRLIRDYAQEKSASIFIEGRVGDGDVPFSTLARSLRQLFASKRFVIDGWAKSELARVVPELFVDSEVGATSTRSKVRFFDAVSHAFRAADGSESMMVLDDLQWIDRASAEVFVWLADESARGTTPLRIFGAYRTGELHPEVAANIQKGVEVGTTLCLTLGPLDERETRELVDALGLDALEGRADAIARASRGIPLFALEIVRSLIESGMPADGVALAMPERVRLLLSKRLERLSEPALRLARVIAVAGPEFELELAAFVLSKDVFDLADPLAELERAQIVTGKRLAHDLLADSVRDALPAMLRSHIHGKTADYLKAKHADAARIAQHLEAAGRRAEAAPLLSVAAHTARGLSRLADGVALFDHAARLYEAEGDLHAASAALYHRARSHMGADADDVVARLDRYGVTDLDKARALLVRANVDLERGDLEGARESATKAYPLAEAAGDRLIVTESLQALLDADMRSGRLDEAERIFELFDASSAKMSDDPEAEIAAVYYRAELCSLRERHREALTHFQSAVDKLDRWGQLAHGKAGILAQMTRSHLALGEIDAARRTVTEAERLLGPATGALQAFPQLMISRGMLLHAEGDSARALDELRRVSAPAHELRLELAARGLMARIRAEQGDFAAAEPELRAISLETRADDRTRRAADATLAYIATQRR
jgi:DNA-binding SARP family transcriptional activator